MRARLAIRGLSRFLAGIILITAMLFWSAGSWAYWNAWLLMGVLFIPILILGIVMLIYSPSLLSKRLSAKEHDVEQRWVVALSGIMFMASFVVAGLNFRFGWTTMPSWVTWVGTAILLLSYILYAEVVRENAYLSRTIEIQEGQTVVDTGLYGIVRHPMYSATILMFLSIPLILSSIISFAIMVACIPIIAIRIKNEERVLETGLMGYSGYKQRVRYKIIPYIW